MNDLSFFNLGFRSDRVFEAFSVADQEQVTQGIITEALEILRDCLTIENQESLVANLTGKSGVGYSIIAPILWQIFPTRKVSEVVAELKHIHETLSAMQEKVERLDQADFEKAKVFFSELADVSLSNSAESVQNKFSVFSNA